jgi:hypothetical protein
LERDWKAGTSLPIQVLHPLRIDIAVEDNPVSFCTFTTDIIDNLSQDMRKESIVPLARSWVQSPIQRILMHSFRINDIRDSFNAIEPFESRHENLPRVCFPSARRANHHETMLDFLNLIKLQDFRNPSIAKNKVPLSTDVVDVHAKFIEVDRVVISSREDVGQETTEKGQRINLDKTN